MSHLLSGQTITPSTSEKLTQTRRVGHAWMQAVPWRHCECADIRHARRESRRQRHVNVLWSAVTPKLLRGQLAPTIIASHKRN